MPSHTRVFLLTDLVLIIVAARLLGALARRLGQPAVIAEIAAGILAGPAVLGPWRWCSLPPGRTPTIIGGCC
ncbi:MAG: hypothetical protein HOQ36_24430 [Nocardia sp.]|nr:hypothetical protein [Nocardia sp.]